MEQNTNGEFDVSQDNEEQLSRYSIQVARHQGVKCPRCWHHHYLKDNYDQLCDKCMTVMLTDHPNDERIDAIKESRRAEMKKWCSRKPDDACTNLKCCRTF